tara:strand:- start:304 stop:1014 length:711 start_codon:yes stop_codon:yes gene_type:complete
MSYKQARAVKDFFKSLILASFFAFLFQTFFYQPFKIPSGSMRPTLLVGDYLFVRKFAYGYNNSSLAFGLGAFGLTEKSVVFSQKKRGDVIVFDITNSDKHYVKRIIGLPGDSIRMHKGELYINGIKVLLKEVSPIKNSGSRVKTYLETLPNGVSYNIYKDADAISTTMPNQTPEYFVPADSIFCLGDNRDNSVDSRYLNEIGFIKEKKVLGKVEFLFWTKALWKSLKTERVFTGIK